MARALNRRTLFARLRAGAPQIRPPWSKPEPAFSDACTQCGRCRDVCPEEIIVRGHAGYPVIDFTRGACTFCGQCAEECTHESFIVPREGKPWRCVVEVSTSCLEARGVACRVCQDACDPCAIWFQPKLGGTAAIIVDATTCTGCGACVAPCPVGAMRIIEGVDAETTS